MVRIAKLTLSWTLVSPVHSLYLQSSLGSCNWSGSVRRREFWGTAPWPSLTCMRGPFYDGQARRVEVNASSAGPLIGMELLRGHKLEIEAVAGGVVSIR